jgi:hypothetical protein
MKTNLKTWIESLAKKSNLGYQGMIERIKSWDVQDIDLKEEDSDTLSYVAFRGLQSPIYLLTKNISESLDLVDSNISINYLLDNLKMKKGYWVETPHHPEILSFLIERPTESSFFIHIFVKGKSYNLWLDFKLGANVLETIAEQIPGRDMEQIKFALKVTIYLLCGEPDLRFWENKLPGLLTKRERDRWKTIHMDMPDFPAYIVGIDWKKPTIYNMDQTKVMGHFRWQPHGENRKKVKLIWIDEHVRVFNK